MISMLEGQFFECVLFFQNKVDVLQQLFVMFGCLSKKVLGLLIAIFLIPDDVFRSAPAK